MSVHKIDAEPRGTGIASNGKVYAKLAYYMVDLPEQKNWKKIPGIVVGDSEADALAKGKIVADQLDGLTVFEMSKKVKAFIADGTMMANARSLK